MEPSIVTIQIFLLVFYFMVTCVHVMHQR